jgi:ABC-type nitrate/sulfonate/bicarbonate transport system substrate-binding protein
VWFTRCPVPTASGIAIDGGWLEREFEGDAVEIQSLRSSNDADHRRSHFTHDSQSLFRQGGVVPPLWAVSNGTPLSLLGISSVRRFHGIVALENGPIRSVGDLRGSRLAIPRRTKEPVDFWRAHVLRGVTLALHEVGVGEDEVTLVDLPTAEPFHTSTQSSSTGSLWTAREAARLQTPEVAALLRSEVDAIYTYAPTGLPLIDLLHARVIVDLDTSRGGGSGIDTLTVLTASNSLIETDFDLAVRYLTALLRAAAWSAEHPDQAFRVFASEEGVAEEWARAGFDSVLPTQLDPNLDAASLVRLQNEASFLFERGFLPRQVDVNSWARPDILHEARERFSKEPITPKGDA